MDKDKKVQFGVTPFADGGAVSRVHQLDAIRFDDQVRVLLGDQYDRIFTHFDKHRMHQFQPEIQAVLSLLMFRYSIWKSAQTYGQSLMNLKYRLTKKQALLLGACSILGPYLWKRLGRLAEQQWNDLTLSSLEDSEQTSWRERLWKWMRYGERAYSLLALFSLIIFLLNARYPTLLHRVLGIRLIYAQRAKPRFRNFEFLNRQLIWQIFSEFVVVLITTLSSGGAFATIRNTFTNFWSQRTSSRAVSQEKLEEKTTSGRRGALENRNRRSIERSACPVCDSNPVRTPYVAIPCGHLYCYYCLRVAKLVQEEYQCPKCSRFVTSFERYIPARTTTLPSMKKS